MVRIDNIEFVRHRVGSYRRHYIDEDDVKVVLSRLPDELYARLKRVLFKDDAEGRRIYGYTTSRGRRDISLCALPYRVSLSQVCTKYGDTPEAYGALRGAQWPTLAVRRYMLYDTFLHEVGHLQIILPKASNPNRRYANESKAQEFADHWRRKLWSQPFDHPDPAHNPPSDDELDELKAGWMEAHLSYKKGHGFYVKREYRSAVPHYRRAVELYPNHTLALEGLGFLTYAGYAKEGGEDGENSYTGAALLRRAVALDPALPDAHLYLAMTLSRLNQQDEAREVFRRAIQLDPCENLAMTVYADNLSDWGCNEEAETLFKKVLTKNPEMELALRYYARHLLFRSEEYVDEETKQAIALLQQALDVDPTDAPTHFNLGLAFSFLDDREPDAVVHLLECLRLKPDHEAAAELLADLTQNGLAGGRSDPNSGESGG